VGREAGSPSEAIADPERKEWIHDEPVEVVLDVFTRLLDISGKLGILSGTGRTQGYVGPPE
jgi:hypothetical protein